MTQGGTGGPSAGNKPDGKPVGKVFLRACPICEEGPVYEAGTTEDAKLYTCRSCKSVMAETIFGFQYKEIDARFEKRKGEYEGQTFTRAQVMKAAEDIYRDRVAVKPAARPDRPQKPTGKAEPELYWQIDKEEVERRKKVADAEAEAKKPLTVDDMLDELKKQSGGG